jgi:nitroreductase
MNEFNDVTRYIRNRRSVYPNQYIQKEIESPLLLDILENANHAPTHRLTQPWRFKVVSGSALNRLADFLADQYREHTPKAKFMESKLEKIRFKCRQSNKILLICFQRDPNESVPEWEEIAATSMAVQNIYLSCSAAGIGCYWSTPTAINHMNAFSRLEEGERCIGLFYMGYFEIGKELSKSPRSAMSEKVTWIE